MFSWAAAFVGRRATNAAASENARAVVDDDERAMSIVNAIGARSEQD
jgi:hypothetical protein